MIVSVAIIPMCLDDVLRLSLVRFVRMRSTQPHDKRLRWRKRFMSLSAAGSSILPGNKSTFSGRRGRVAFWMTFKGC